MRHVAAGAILSALLITGCAVPYSGQDISGSRPSNVAARPVFATQLAGPSTFLAPLPTAVVLLTPGDLNRNRAFCNAFTSRLPTAQAAMAASVVAPNLIMTRWLVQLADVPASRAADCDFLVGTYDYTRAARLLKAVRLSEGQLSGPGPFLLMVIPDSAGLHVAGLDGSARNSADFGQFIDEWGTALRDTQEQVSRTPDQPGLVKSVFNLVSAILRTAAGGAAGLIRGVVNGL
ncbi:MAG: hypothetical protein ACRYF2_00745 [Janthinobacterium lividum]